MDHINDDEYSLLTTDRRTSTHILLNIDVGLYLWHANVIALLVPHNLLSESVPNVIYIGLSVQFVVLHVLA